MTPTRPDHLRHRESEVLSHLRDGDLALLLDFDGTLAPIVPRAGDAQALPGSRRAIERLVEAGRAVAVISGRGLADVRARLGLEGIHYAGNHGLEIEGPGVMRRHPEAERGRARLEEVRENLLSSLEGIPGAWVEDKGLTLSVHYREAEPESWRAVEGRVRSASADEALEVRAGKRVWEVRPRVDWDKGRAVGFLLQVWGEPRRWPVYVGDDVTDEDAFRVVHGVGLGVKVTEEPDAPTAAAAWVRDPSELESFLERWAADIGSSDG
jgi:trehalose 6-phosphate phosphatase